MCRLCCVSWDFHEYGRKNFGSLSLERRYLLLVLECLWAPTSWHEYPSQFWESRLLQRAISDDEKSFWPSMSSQLQHGLLFASPQTPKRQVNHYLSFPHHNTIISILFLFLFQIVFTVPKSSLDQKFLSPLLSNPKEFPLSLLCLVTSYFHLNTNLVPTFSNQREFLCFELPLPFTFCVFLSVFSIIFVLVSCYLLHIHISYILYIPFLRPVILWRKNINLLNPTHTAYQKYTICKTPLSSLQ